MIVVVVMMIVIVVIVCRGIQGMQSLQNLLRIHFEIGLQMQWLFLLFARLVVGRSSADVEGQAAPHPLMLLFDGEWTVVVVQNVLPDGRVAVVVGEGSAVRQFMRNDELDEAETVTLLFLFAVLVQNLTDDVKSRVLSRQKERFVWDVRIEGLAEDA